MRGSLSALDGIPPLPGAPVTPLPPRPCVVAPCVVAPVPGLLKARKVVVPPNAAATLSWKKRSGSASVAR